MTLLHHIALGARDPGALSDFYSDVFDLDELSRHEDARGELRSVWLDLGGAILMIERTRRSRPRVEELDAGVFLLAFDVEPARRDAMISRLEQAGAAIESETEFTTYARDPEGNRVAISHYPEPRET